MRRRQQRELAAAQAAARARLAAAGPPTCGLCQRQVRATSRHHLVPREEGGRYGPVADLCQPCHSSVHRFLSNRELARRYPSVEALREAPELQEYLDWIRKTKVESVKW